MNCCSNCFSDTTLKSIISSFALLDGNCDFCNSKNTFVLECDKLAVHFEPLFELYSNPSKKDYTALNSRNICLLHLHLKKYWKRLFSESLDLKTISNLVLEIGKNSHFPLDLFTEPIEINQLLSGSARTTERLQIKWDSFSEEIKTKNRFFLSEQVDLDNLEYILSKLVVCYPENTVFYRARISDSILHINELGKPKFSETTPGRANPFGIPYLYVSDSEETTLYETRIALHETITIGKYISNAPISLISLKNISDYGPFEILAKDFLLEEFIEYRPYLIKIEQELSKPVRKQDVNLDYLPTQFLCEFIKSKLGMDAVEYRSAMNPEGYNLAVFNDDKLKCVDAKFYRVTDLEYKYESAN